MARFNKCPNPFWTTASTTTGVAGSAGATPTRAFFDASPAPRPNGWQVTANNDMLLPAYQAGSSIAGTVWTVSFWARRNSGASGSHTIAIQWLNSGGGVISTSTTASFTLASGGTAGTRMSRANVTAPTNATGLRGVLSGTTNVSIQATAVLYEQVSALGTYFDGDGDDTQYNGVNDGTYSWDGTPNLSTSSQGDIQTNLTSTDNTTATEQIALSTNNLITDQGTHTDVYSINTNILITDVGAHSDQSNINANLILNDQAIHTEQISIIEGTFKELTDQAIHSEIANIAATLNIIDTALATEQFNVATFSTSTDQSTHSESINIAIPVQDSSTHLDTITISPSVILLDQSTHSDLTNLFGPAFTNDQAIHSDSVSLNSSRTTQDQGFHTEQVIINVVVTDTHVSIDQTRMFSAFQLQDVFVTTDLIAKFKTGSIVREDQITYPEPLFIKPRNPFRIIAQDIFTREFFHWDVPIVDPQLTFRVTGSNSFKGQLRGDVRYLSDVSDQFIEDRTLLHCEEDGVIRHTTILMPFIDSNGEQIRQIEGIGISDMPNRRYYLGPAVEFVYADPMTIIRYLWAYMLVGQGIQDFIDIRIPANVSTPVRIGKPKKNVNFQTSNGKNVDFDAGPIDFNFWEVSNIGTEMDKLYKETPIEYTEQSIWNSTRTNTIQTMNYGYPRVGSAKTTSYFRDGENIKETIPEYVSSRYPRSVTVVGAGEGPTAIRATCAFVSGDIKRVPYDLVLESEDIQTYARAFAIAKAKLLSLYRARYSMKSIRIDTTHPNAQLGTFAEGDDIFVETNIRAYGRVADWQRITEWDYFPTLREAELQISPSASFPYGATLEVEK